MIDVLGIGVEQFENTKKVMSEDTKTAEFILVAQQGKLIGEKPLNEATLSKEAVMKYIEKSFKLSIKAAGKDP